MDIYFTSDTHFFHSNIIEFCSRPFQSIDEMNECLISNWNSKIKHSDIIYHLGDFSFANTTKSLEILNRLKGKIHLIRGNHDLKQSNNFLEKFVWVKDYFELRLNGSIFVMSHYPFLTWNKKHHNKHNTEKQSYNLYGHIHSLENTKESLQENRFDVGVDANMYTPIHIDEIIERVKISKYASV